MLNFLKKRWIKTYDFTSADGSYTHEIYKCERTGEVKHKKIYNSKILTKTIKKCKQK